MLALVVLEINYLKFHLISILFIYLFFSNKNLRFYNFNEIIIITMRVFVICVFNNSRFVRGR